ncbi:phage integrase, N-terminal SAM domain protein [Leptospira weilii str. Ecochallenge]|uniref:Phage integrase, N-terminal SAM domain protein n=1 Tax=Leptospira weilii str. Ecochallenge TaxID=1049986 RepID=N1UC71_9LEPT|nr:phage integrase, N-terminal SAM domain protein [Leptospira weilii str. Ecochallenge]
MRFLNEERDRKISSKTIAREVVAIRQFYKFLKDEKNSIPIRPRRSKLPR